MNCPICNSPIPDNARFCVSCGNRLSGVDPAQARPANPSGSPYTTPLPTEHPGAAHAGYAVPAGAAYAGAAYAAGAGSAGWAGSPQPGHVSAAPKKKSAVPKIAASIVLLALLIAGVGWFVLGNSESGETFNGESVSVYTGTWTGKFTGTDANYACYGGQEHPVEITIKSLDVAGKMKVDVKALFHGHNQYELKHDVDSYAGDIEQEWLDQTATLEGGQFKVVIPQTGIENAADLVVQGRFSGTDGNKTLEVSVSSGLGGSTRTDKYELLKS